MDDQDTPTEQDLFSRSAYGSPYGKCLNPLTLRLSDDMLADLQSEALKLRLPVAELAREIIAVHLWGVDHVRKLHQEELERKLNKSIYLVGSMQGR